MDKGQAGIQKQELSYVKFANLIALSSLVISIITLALVYRIHVAERTSLKVELLKEKSFSFIEEASTIITILSRHPKNDDNDTLEKHSNQLKAFTVSIQMIIKSQFSDEENRHSSFKALVSDAKKLSRYLHSINRESNTSIDMNVFYDLLAKFFTSLDESIQAIEKEVFI